MHNNILKRIFEFLEEKEGHNVPFLWKFENDIPLTEGDLNVKGVLDLFDSKITSLPEGLEVRYNLYIGDSPLIKYSAKELREMIKPGFIKGRIVR